MAVYISTTTSIQNDTDASDDKRSFEEPFSTFAKFPKLAAELRLKVWKYVCCVTRNLVLQVKDLRQDDGATNYTPYYFYSSCPVPAVLGVCQESRVEALRHYKLEFEVNETWELKRGKITCEIPATIYVNWNFDRICIFNPAEFEVYTYRFVPITDRLGKLRQKFHDRKLRYLAYQLDSYDDLMYAHTPDHRQLMPLSQDKTHLEELIMFYDDDDLDYSYSTHGKVDFGPVSEHEMEDFEFPVDDLCEAIHCIYGVEEHKTLPPMPFDVRCAKIHFAKGQGEGTNRQKAKAGKISPGDQGNGTLIALKGETWTYRHP